MDGGAGTVEDEIIQGIGNEVFYFFMFLSLMLVIVGAWFSTQVVEPVVSSVILVERTSTAETQRRDGEQNRTEYIQYRLDPNGTRPTGLVQPGSSVNSRPQQHARIQHNYTADLQRITEPRRQESSGSSQVSASNHEEIEASSSSGVASIQESEQDKQLESLQPIPDQERVIVRLKFLNDTERDVEASLLENLATFRRRNFTEEISENKSVRFIFNGQMLREESNTLRSYGMFDKCVVHCLIQQQAPSARTSTGSSGEAQGAGVGAPNDQQHNQNQDHPQEDDHDFDVSELFIPVLGFGLIILWYFAFTYSTYFNSMSTSALLGLTSLFLFTLYGTNVHINVITRN